GGIQLGDAAVQGVADAAPARLGAIPRRLVNEQPRRLDAHLHVGDLRLDGLERADRRAERVAFPGIRERGVIGGLRDAERLGRDADAAGVQHRHRDAEALTFLAEPVLDRAAVVVQLDLAGRGCADAELRLRFAAYEPRLLRVDDERADARVFARALGAGEQDDVARHRPGRDPGF